MVKSRKSMLAFVAALLTVLIAGAWGIAPASASAVSQKVDPRVLADTANGARASFLVVLAEQADVSGAATLDSKTAKTTYVYEQLTAVATRTQPTIIAQLDSLGVAYRPYWITNMVMVESGDRALVETLANNAAVGRIEPNRAFRGVPDQPVLGPEDAPPAPIEGAPEWGIMKINADDVWAQGFRGAGMVVANQDTGQDWTHPALQDKYRGWNGSVGDHNYNWWDAIHADIDGNGNVCGFNLQAPCDDNGHGTHTVGTAVGSDGANEIGVAPEAKWIGCRNMDEGVGRPNTYSECFQFFLAPTDLAGANANPALAPDVISNSWGCPLGAPPGGEDCVVDSFKTIIENIRTAGITVVVSNGNNGSACATTLSPPSYLDAATSVGSTTSSDAISGFSSRGPVTADGSNRIKPDISAPGSAVRSALPGGGYGTLSGTSMAAPHVAGAIALLLDARPQLSGNVDAIEAALFGGAEQLTTTQNCGGVPGTSIPNNTFGYGRLDILAAIEGVAPTAVALTAVSAVPAQNGVALVAFAALGLLVLAGAVVSLRKSR